MCGIAGFFNPSADYTKEKNYRNHILEMMNQVQKHRGPDDEAVEAEGKKGDGNEDQGRHPDQQAAADGGFVLSGRGCTHDWNRP